MGTTIRDEWRTRARGLRRLEAAVGRWEGRREGMFGCEDGVLGGNHVRWETEGSDGNNAGEGGCFEMGEVTTTSGPDPCWDYALALPRGLLLATSLGRRVSPGLVEAGLMRRCEIAGRGPSRDEGSAVQDIASLSAAACLGAGASGRRWNQNVLRRALGTGRAGWGGAERH